jgi:flavin reductase (DIM6/NTAB) family NADH-FMN oxidoreductase RutF
MKELPLSEVYRLIEPGPVIMVTTCDGKKQDIMTMSWHMMVDFNPPLLSFVMSSANLSQSYLRKTGECVIAIPGADLMDIAIEIGNCSGRDLDKFKKFPITAARASLVKAPLVKECLANLECRVVNDSLADDYELFVLEVVKAWTSPDRKEQRIFHANGNGTFAIKGEVRDLSAKMSQGKS